MKPILLTDLDDTLFQTFSKCGTDLKELTPMSTLADGTPSGYATPVQANFLAWLGSGVLIPVTARSREVLGRVNVPQAPGICANGGCIIQADSTIDNDWHQLLKEASAHAESLTDVYARVTSGLNQVRFRHWIVREQDLDLYVVVKSNVGSCALDGIQLARLDEGWRVHRNGNNLAILPPWLGKRAAAKYLIEQFRGTRPNSPIIGIGDSVSDAGFMDLCDFAMMPTNSQLWAEATQKNIWLS